MAPGAGREEGPAQLSPLGPGPAWGWNRCGEERGAGRPPPLPWSRLSEGTGGPTYSCSGAASGALGAGSRRWWWSLPSRTQGSEKLEEMQSLNLGRTNSCDVWGCNWRGLASHRARRNPVPDAHKSHIVSAQEPCCVGW